MYKYIEKSMTFCKKKISSGSSRHLPNENSCIFVMYRLCKIIDWKDRMTLE